MDIFTTVLTRVVPVPIKPANLKVKALLKEAGASKLKEDSDHLENHDYYFGENKLGREDNPQNREEDKYIDDEHTARVDAEFSSENQEESNEEGITKSKDGVKHLDIYV